MIKKNKSGRYYDTKTGLIVSNAKVKKLLSKHHHNYPKHRHSIAVKKLTVRENKNGEFDFNLGSRPFNDGELLYIANCLKRYVNKSMDKYDNI